MVSRALRIVVVSEDRQHLRDCFDFFVACGYEVETRCDSVYRESDSPEKKDVLIYDYDGSQKTISHNNLFKIAVVPAEKPDLVQKVISEAADDVVLKPVTPYRYRWPRIGTSGVRHSTQQVPIGDRQSAG